MNRIFLIVGFIFYTTTCFGQVAKEDFEKINKAYAKHSTISMQVTYDLYRNKVDKTVLQSQQGEFKRSGNLYCSRIGTVQTLDTEKYKLILDEEDKNITLLGKDNSTPEEANRMDVFSMNFDRLLAMCSKVVFKAENESQNSYVLSFENDEYDEMKLVFNKKTFFLEKMLLFYSQAQNMEGEKEDLKEKPRLEITYSNIKLDVRFPENEFSYDKYLIKKDGKLVGKAGYKEYTINDQLFNN